jgi:hypothetical protein
MSDSAAPSAESGLDASMVRKASLLVGCLVRTRRGSVGQVIEIGQRDFRVYMESGAQKQFLLSHLGKFTIVRDVERDGQWGRLLEGLSQPRPRDCESCGRPLTDLVSIAVGLGPSCRSKLIERQQRRARAAREADDIAGYLSLLDDETTAQTIIHAYGLKR